MTPNVYALLRASGAVTALVADRIYRFGAAPQGVAKPYITWQVVAGHTENYLSNAPGIDQQRVQLDVWATAQSTCDDLKEAVVSALENDGSQASVPMDSFESDTSLYRYTIEFYFWISR